MGSLGKSPKQVVAEQVTPAVARQASDTSGNMSQAQKDARGRMFGIRGTYNRFATEQGSGGTSNKLG